MAVPRDPNKPPPPPDLRSVPGAHSGPLVGTSVIESGLARDARLAREAAAALPVPDPRTPLPAPMSELGEVPPLESAPPGQAPLAVRAATAWVPRDRTRIAAPPVRVEIEPSLPVSTARTLDHIAVAPQAPPVVLNEPGKDGSVMEIVISSLRSATDADKAWALPKRVGSTVPAINVPGIGWIRFSSVIGVIVDSTEQDLRSGRQVVYVTVVFSPDPGDGMMKAKLRSGNKLLHGQLVAGIAAAFSSGLPPIGKVLRFVAGSPTMTEAEATMAGYTARKVDPDGKLRAPVRAEFSLEEVARREQEVRELYEDMQRDLFQFWIRMVLFWWWCIGFLMPSHHARLAAYKTGEQASKPGAEGMRFSRLPVSRIRENAALESAAELAKGVSASHSSLVWMVSELRAALAEKGVRVEEIAGTRLGTMIADDEDISRK